MQVKSLICFALLVSMVFSGHIYYLDPETSYGNTGEVTQISIHFKLTNTLPTGLMVEVDFGVALGSSKGYLFEMGSPSYTTDLSPAVSSNIVRVTTKSDLSNTKWYTLCIKPNSVPGALTAGLIVGPIKLSTISGTTDGIVYDRNPVGPSFAIQAAPTTTDITLAKESDVATNKNDLGASHDIDVAITNKQERKLGGYYLLKLSSTDFEFTADCKGKAVPCPAQNPPAGCKDVVVPTDFSCKKVDAQNLEIKLPAWNVDKFVVTVNVKNPTYAASAVNLDVKAVSMSKHTVVSIKSLASLASVTVPTLTTAEPKYHWGIAKRATTNYDKAHIGLYKEDSNKVNDGVYNSVHVYVTFAKACPHVEHKVTFDFIETGKIKFLTGSFVTNLPKLSGKELSFTVADNKVAVGNVGALAAQEYTLSCRFTLKSNVGATIAAFGKVNVDTVTSGSATALIAASGGNTVDVVAQKFVPETKQLLNMGFTQVVSVDKISSPENAANIVTALGSLTKGSPDGKLGIQIKSAAQTLVFFLSGYVCGKTDSGTDTCVKTVGVSGTAFATAEKKEYSSLFSVVMPITTITISSAEVAKGVMPILSIFGKKDVSPVLCSSASLVVNDNSTPQTGKTCSGYNTGSQANLVNTITEVAGKYRYIAFACVNPSNPAATKKTNSYCSFTSDILDDKKNGGAFIIPEVTLASYKGPTQYADANVMEFPLAFLSGDVAGAAANFNTVNQNTLIQAYAITGVPTTNFNQVVLVNQVSATDGDAAQVQGNGAYWPVLLRVSGKLSVGGSAITAFFGLEGASNLEANYGSNGMASGYPCVSTEGTSVTCTAGSAPVSVQDAFYMNQNYVTVNAAVTADTEFNFYVPVSAPNSLITKKVLNIAAHLAPQTAAVNAGVFRCFAAKAPWGAVSVTTNGIYSDDTFRKTISNTDYAGCAFTDYGFALGNTFLAGAAPATVTVNAKTTACTNVAVSNTLKGTTVSLIALTSNLWSGVTAKLGGTDKTCGQLTYTVPGTVNTRYVIVCKATTLDASSTVTLTGFKVPGTWGKAYTIGTDFQFGASNNKGQLIYLKANAVQGNVANTGCELTALTATFPKSVQTRASFQVKTTKPFDLPNTKKVDITVTMASGNNYFSSVASCSTPSFASTCAQSNGGLTFQHTATATVNGVQTIVTDFIGASNAEAGATTYTAVVKYETYEIDACSTAKAWKGSGVAATAFKTTASPFSYMTKDTKQSFTVTFGVGGSQNIGKTDTVVFNFGSFLASAKLTGSRCVPLTNGKVDAGWQKVSSASWGAVTLTASATVSGSSTITCYGVGPAGAGAVKLNGIWKVGGSNAAETSADVDAPTWTTGYTLTTTALDATLSKNETVAGQATVYGLLIKPAKNYTNPVVRVVFANQIAPRLNPCGALTCKQDGYPVNCQWNNEEGVVLINSREDFVQKTINTGGYNFQIWGVVQPKTVSTAEKMVVAITSGSTVTEQVELSEVAPNAAKTVKVAEVVTGSYSTNTTRSNTDITQNITLPSASVVADAVGTVILPDWVPCFNAPSVSVSLVNYKDTANTELVKSASVNPNCSVSIVLNVDSLNAAAAQNYKFTVSSVPTPASPNGGMSTSWPVLNLVKGTDLYKNFPGSSDVKPIVFGQPAASVYATVDWSASVVDAYVGYWTAGPKLVPASGSFPTTTTLTVGGATSSISVAPAKPLISVGAKDAEMMIGAKPGTKRGLYRLTFTKGATDSSSLSPVPDLRVNVKDTKCTINVPATISVPAGGVSVPQVVSFDSCLPLVDVSLEATWTDPNAVANANANATPDTKPTFTLDKATKTVKYTAGMMGAMVYYILSNNNSTLKAESNVRKLYWKLGGTNKDSYALSTLSSNMGVAAAAGTESPTATVTATPAAGKVDLTFTCNQVGYVVWAAAYETTTNPIGSVTLDSISAATFNVSVPLTNVDSNNNDLVQGFNIVTTKDKAIKVSLKKVASALKYNLVAYCVSGSKTSPSKTATWTQTDNGGKPSVIQFTASSQLTDADQLKLVCGCVKTLALPVPRITSQNGVTCTSLLPASSTSSTRMLQNTTNSTSNTTTTTPAAPSVYPAFVFVAPDVYAVVDNTNTFVTNEVAKSTFKADVISKGNLPASVNITAVVSKTVTASVASAPTPTFVDATPAATNNSLSVNARLDAEGFVFLGVILATGATKPTALQLVGGKDGADVALNATNKAYTDKNTNKLVNLTGLSALTEYKVYLCASNIAATKDRVYSTVIEKTMTTLNAYVLSMASMVMIALFGFAIMI